MEIVLTTISLGENYTRDYACKLINDVLSLSDIKIYLTTDNPKIIYESFGNNERIKVNEINRDDLQIRVKIDEHADDFNFNLKYLCFEPVKDLDETVVIYTDCDCSFDWWDRNEVESFINQMRMNGYDFYAPRNDAKWFEYKDEYIKNNKSNVGIFWHKIYNYDIDLNSTEWDNAPLPAEYLLIFYNNNQKLNKFHAQWKWFHDYLINRKTSKGTWAEGFEIGVSSFVSGFKDFDIGWSHPIWSRMFMFNGYKNGHKGDVYHATDKQ
jgi:uncharacterized pyridoxamine 5'-phosphate oxidase family protein